MLDVVFMRIEEGCSAVAAIYLARSSSCLCYQGQLICFSHLLLASVRSPHLCMGQQGEARGMSDQSQKCSPVFMVSPCTQMHSQKMRPLSSAA